MTYPKPIRPLEGEAAEKFEKEMRTFRVRNAQRARINVLRAKVREKSSDK